MTRPARARPALVIAVLILAVGCGGDEAPPAAPSPTTAPTPTEEPSPSPRVYVVRRGDTLSEIAQRFGTTIRALVRANKLKDPDRIFPGDELVIPEE